LDEEPCRAVITWSLNGEGAWTMQWIEGWVGHTVEMIKCLYTRQKWNFNIVVNQLPVGPSYWLFQLFLTYMGPRIANVFTGVTNEMQRYTIYLFLWNALHVSGGSSAHLQELKNSMYGIGYWNM